MLTMESVVEMIGLLVVGLFLFAAMMQIETMVQLRSRTLSMERLVVMAGSIVVDWGSMLVPNPIMAPVDQWWYQRTWFDWQPVVSIVHQQRVEVQL
jgi:hypothetical protein